MSDAAPTAPAPVAPERDSLVGRIVGSRLFWVVFVMMAFAVPLALSMNRDMPDPLPVHGRAPAFALHDQDGEPFTHQQLRGKVNIIGFFFTSCTTVCPMVSARMGLLQHRLRNLRPAVQLVSVSVDPERDTSERLSDYASSFHARPDVWKFVTGDQSEIERVVTRGFRQALGRPQGHRGHVDAFDIVHSAHLVLVDPRGRIRGFYDSNDADRIAQLVRDAGLMANLERQ